uniref:Sushi, nidogen and EGF-like domain-containing protein 1 isoform X1 n=1 Tax=Crassostrea virginica TaxID=6565 RepID=A0A8B8A9P1_CRAVI|nr:sushi, nidogen and EGF-like domain-containing protein 1 isoform X1 [Crassostrea virginica]
MIAKFFILTLWHLSDAGISPTWHLCDCHWEQWTQWSQCSASCGGGKRYRTREVWHKNIPECMGFDKCASSDMGFYISTCNTICYNGSPSGGLCSCQIGWHGKCCNRQIDCGNPGVLIHGYLEGASFTYNSHITYHCNRNYNLTRGTETSKCLVSGKWSGKKPICVPVSFCESSLCMNNGRCVDRIGYYNCICTEGFSGSNCEKEINCGNPGFLRHGSIQGNSYTYNSEIVHYCDQFYNLTGGNKIRICRSNEKWSGVKPRCAFVDSCQSNPCLNQGVCINILDDYSCLCTEGFNGSTCEIGTCFYICT